MKSSFFEIVSTRRSTVLILPFQKGFTDSAIVVGIFEVVNAINYTNLNVS